MLNGANRSEIVTFKPNRENPEILRPPFAPPRRPLDRAETFFWNERELRAGWRLFIYILFFGFFAMAGTLLAAAPHFPHVTRTEMTATALLVQEAIGMIAALVAAAIMRLLEGRIFGVYGLPGPAAFGARFWQGIAWGFAMITAIIFLIRLLGGFTFGDLILHGAALWWHAALWGVVFLCVGFFEEFLFRGYTQFTLATGIGFWPAATSLSAAFGLLHLFNGGEDKVGALSVFVIGMFFCLTLRRTGNLWFAVGLHAAFDWGETFLFSVPNSGILAPGHLMNSSFHGPAWLTGGSVGPEGSVMAFAVVAVAALVFSAVYPEREEIHQPD